MFVKTKFVHRIYGITRCFISVIGIFSPLVLLSFFFCARGMFGMHGSLSQNYGILSHLKESNYYYYGKS